MVLGVHLAPSCGFNGSVNILESGDLISIWPIKHKFSAFFWYFFVDANVFNEKFKKNIIS